jgi:hypothetical protein
MFRPRRFILGAVFAIGCTGSIAGDPSTTPPGKTGPSPDPTTVPGAAPLRRLTRLEYDNTIRDLLGIAMPLATNGDAFAPDQESALSGFVKGAAVTGGSDARIFMVAAEQIGAAIASKLPTLLPCNPIPTATGEQDACADKFITTFGRRAFRRPLAGKEVENLRALYKAQRAAPSSATFEEAIGGLVTGILQAPQFLYHWELGPNAALKDGTLVRFNSYEVASRLSYLFWASMPDEKLFSAAEANELLAPERIAQEARRLLGDAKAKDGLRDFHTQWLEIDTLGDVPKDDTFKDYSPAVAQAMLDETRDFVASIYTGPQATGKLETLLASPSSVVDASLAKIYGAKGPGAVMLGDRAGIFTHLGFLAMKAEPDKSNPVKRGDAVLRRALCTELEVPVGVVVPPVAEPAPGVTTRERFTMHSMNPCATCHTIIDPMGFAFERYDAIGALRTTEENKPIDASGKVSLQSGDISFKDAVELMTKIAQTPEARACMAKQWLRYAMRRRELPTEDAALVNLRDVFQAAGYDLRELVVAVTKTRSFTHRAPSAGEVLQ